MTDQKTRRPRAQSPMDPSTLGDRLRTVRKQLGWTLTQLAELSGVSITTISRAERGQLALGYENVAALAEALQLDLGALFSGEAGGSAAHQTSMAVTRAGQGSAYRGHALTYEFLATSVVGKPINPVLGTIHARRVQGPQDFARHAGVEFVYVLAGEVEVHFENGEKVRLAKGDSLYFDSRIGHAFTTVSRQLAKVIGVITAESKHMALARQGETHA